jgi:hypothetical protein
MHQAHESAPEFEDHADQSPLLVIFVDATDALVILSEHGRN